MIENAEGTKNFLNKKRIFVFTILMAVFIFLLPLLQYGLKWIVATSYANEIQAVTGLNSYLVTAISIVIGFVVVIGFKKLLFNWKNPMQGALILLGVTVVFNVGLYFSTKDNYRGKCYAETPEGIMIYDCKNETDPKYGITLQKITPQKISEIIGLQQGCNEVDPQSANFFNTYTGDAQVWYLKLDDGSYDFYDGPCHHPQLGELTQPVTKEVFENWQEYSKQIKEEQEKEEDLIQTKRAKEAALLAEQKRINDFLVYVNTNIASSSRSRGIGFAVQKPDWEPLPVTRILTQEFEKIGLSFLNNFFIPDFTRTAYFENFFQGHTGLLRDSNLLNYTNYLLLGKLDYSCREGSGRFGLYACDIDFIYNIINNQGDIISSDIISVVGPGGTETKALRRGLELIVEDHGDRIRRVLL